jgi:DNA-directed RNA polymerase subunit F
MNKDRINEMLSIALGIISVLAIIGLLINSNFDTNELLGSIVNFTQVAIPVLVLLVATTIKKENKSFSQIGKEALMFIQKKNEDFLMGPRYNRENYDPEKGQGLEYLFVTNTDPKSKLRAKLIPIQPLEEGVLAIYIQKGTLVYGLNYSSEQATPEEIKKIQLEVFNSVSELTQNKYAGFYEILPNSKDDTAIILDFNEEKMGKKKFTKAITECTELAISKIKSHKK